ncbi:insecticidal delta-endotoxin Cry8Ea1 family protein (plasmid) [Bacillus thuringiensis]|uniref:insecticidal delta-endotoxin Cry8Ea1 family protein n=1 Tax=Bacillus thuringiensis TaxID=1428 RepID=UPI00397744C0
MSPNNQNEYEIIDATPSTSVSNDTTRYPFANEPTNALQNMNYKDYLRMSEGYDSEYAGSPEALINEKDAIKIGIDIVGKILGFLGVPFAGQIVSFYNFILNQLWPSNSVSVWEQIMTLVEELVDQKITEYARNKAIAELRGLGDALNVYQDSLEAWLKNPNDTRARSVVSTQFIALELDFVEAIPSFAVSGQEVPLLAVYAQAVNMHLLLLRDVSIFGEEWGFTASEISTYYNRQVRLTPQYTDYCVKWYNTGLNKLKGTSAESWLKYHQFRREMTLMALDLVALFPNYDTHVYPIETTAQLTRDVYTDPIAFNIRTSTGFCNPWSTHSGILFSEVEKDVIRTPHLFDMLSSVEINTGKGGIALNNNAYINYWIGHSLKYYRTNRSQTSTTVNYGRITTEKNAFELGDRDVFEINSTAANLANAYQSAYGVPESWFHMVQRGTSSTTAYLYSKTHTTLQGCTQVYESSDEIPLDRTVSVAESYSHRLSHITFHSFSKNSAARYGSFPVFVWTHRSADLENTIYPEKITQIPAVKAYSLGGFNPTFPITGPGFTGGDVVPLGSNGSLFIKLTFQKPQNYRIRIRYAASKASYLLVEGLHNTSESERFEATYSNKNENDLTFKDFKYLEFRKVFSINDSSTIRNVNISTQSDTESMIIDRIEFIPVDETYETEQDLENAQKAVNTLFTNTKDGLRPGVTDYEVNQAANLVECLSDDLYPNEKRLLFDAVKEAKRLSEARNLLQDPDFQELNGENGWTASTGIEIVEGDTLFKGRYLRLPGAREMDTETYPTYLYQKIDEGVLKPYTRYRLRGFVGSSQGLEIYTIRHQTNRIVKNVPDNLLPDASPRNAGDGINRCSEQKYVNSRLEGEKGLPNGSRSAEAHEFSLPIDIGEVDYNENAGVWVGFKITDPEGYATLGNLELVEEGPLSGDTLERVKREEQQWKIQMTKRREETDRKYMIAKQAVDRLYADYQDQQLNPNVEITDITAAQNVIQSIPYVYNDAFPGLPGMNYTKFTELTDRLQQAWGLYDQRNVIPNGDFRSELSNWNTTSGVNVQQINNTSVLVIPSWDAQVSQQFTVQPNQRYVLRVTARKEGVGNGYVSIRDGGNQTETLTFSASDYDTNGYNTNSGYNTQASNANGYNANNTYNTQMSNTNGYNTNNAYDTQVSNTNGYDTNTVYNDQTGYITKTVTFIPYTDQVWIEMSETEGIFYIESVELLVDVE